MVTVVIVIADLQQQQVQEQEMMAAVVTMVRSWWHPGQWWQLSATPITDTAIRAHLSTLQLLVDVLRSHHLCNLWLPRLPLSHIPILSPQIISSLIIECGLWVFRENFALLELRVTDSRLSNWSKVSDSWEIWLKSTSVMLLGRVDLWEYSNYKLATGNQSVT